MRAASPPAADGDGPDTPRAARGGETIYLRHFSLAVETVMRERTELCELFSTEERALAAPFLPAGGPADFRGAAASSEGAAASSEGAPPLSREARGLYTRMLQRKGPWFRLDSLIKYDELLSDWQEGGDKGVALHERNERAQRAVKELEACSLVSVIAAPASKSGSSTPSSSMRANPDKREVFEAVAACLRLDEIKNLLARVAKHPSSSLNRRDALARLEQACIGQRTLTDFFSKKGSGSAGGGEGHERLLQELAQVLAPALGYSSHAAGSGMAGGGKEGPAGSSVVILV
jgi:hypothetical protein